MPTLFAAVLAAVIAGGLESWIDDSTYRYTPIAHIAAIGFAGFYGVPIGVSLLLLVRGLWWAWSPRPLLESLREETGGAPRLAGWLCYLLFSTVAFASVSFNVIRQIMRKTLAMNVVALGATMTAVATLSALVVLSRPGVRLLSAGFRSLDRRVHRRWQRTPLRPVYILVVTALLLVGACYLSWSVSIRPRIGFLDLGFLWYPSLFLVVATAAHLSWSRIPAQKAVFAGVGVLALSCLVSACYLRYQRPFVMLDIWGSTTTAGAVIDHAYDIEELRSELPLAEIALERRPGAKKPDVILVTIDTLRADYTPPFPKAADMPALKKVVDTGAVFQWAYSPSNNTRRSIPTMATGIGPRRINGRVVGWSLRLDPRHILLAEYFRAAGYDTAGFFCCETLFGRSKKLGLSRGLDLIVTQKDGEILTEQAVTWLDKRSQAGESRPLFMWLHYFELHLKPKNPPPKSEGPQNKVKRRKWLYKRKLREIDGYLDKLFAATDRGKNRDGVIIALSSDHGEGLMDDGHPYHSTTLSNAQVRVPLILKGPDIRPARIAQPMGLVDLPPTLLDLAGFLPPGMPTMDGVSLAPLLRGEARPVVQNGEAHAVMIRDRSVRHEMHAVVRGRYKLIIRSDKEEPELYDLRLDGDEKRNLAPDKPDVVKRLQERIDRQRERDAIPPF